MSSTPLTLTAQMAAVAVVAAAVALTGHTGQPYKAVRHLLKVHTTSYSRATSQQSVGFVAARDAAKAALLNVCQPYSAPAADRLPGPISAPTIRRPHMPSQNSPALKAAKEAVEPAPVRPAHRVASPPRGSAYGRATAVRMKPLTGRKLRFCRRFLNAGWDLDEVAYLFDVSPDALAIQCRGLAA